VRAKPSQASKPSTKRRKLPRFKDRLSIGDGLAVSPFCLGIVTDWRVIPAAFEMGINFFFITTDMHWPLYEATRKGVQALIASRRGIRDEIAVAGVCYPTQPEFCIAPFHELVQALPGLERVDVLVAGGVYGPELLGRIKMLRQVAAARQAPAVAASFHDRNAAITGANASLVDLGYIRYNPAHPRAKEDLFPHLHARRAPLYNFKSMRGYVGHDKLKALGVDPSLWYPEAPDYYRYALSRPQMDGLLFALDHASQLGALEAALKKGGLTPAEEEHLEELAILTGQSDHRMQ